MGLMVVHPPVCFSIAILSIGDSVWIINILFCAYFFYRLVIRGSERMVNIHLQAKYPKEVIRMLAALPATNSIHIVPKYRYRLALAWYTKRITGETGLILFSRARYKRLYHDLLQSEPTI